LSQPEKPVWDDAVKAEIEVRAGDQPNILMIFSDQHNAQMSGFMGDELVATPNLDRLAAEGVVFDNAYCNSPLCSPSRQSFMAGLHCHAIGMWNNTAAMPPDTVTWAHMLSAAGYETSLIGKMHFNGYETMYGFDRRPVLEGSNSGKQFHSWGIRTSHEWSEPLPYLSGVDGIRTQLGEAGPDVPERQPIFQHDLRVRQGTLDMLKGKAADTSGQPWAACAGFVLPHPPYRARPDVFERYRGKGDLPFNQAGEGRDTCDRYLQHFNGNPGELPDDVTRNGREAYFALITEFDEYVGDILRALDETGQAENTVVFYFSDHGDLAGEHGLWGKVSLLENSVRVPMIARWKGHFNEGTRVDTPVSLVDLYPTFIDIAGAKMPQPLPLHGHSLVPLMTGQPEAFGGGDVFGEFEGEGWNHPRAFLRSGRFKYVCNHTAEERLYDLDADPMEMSDLAGDPAHAGVLAELRGKMMADWDPADIERRVIEAQTRRKIARCRNVCENIGW
jgi:choline-sulfatase